jgi:hypothetical protein
MKIDVAFPSFSSMSCAARNVRFRMTVTSFRFEQPGPSLRTMRVENEVWLRDSLWLRARLAGLGFPFEDAHELAFGLPYDGVE